MGGHSKHEEETAIVRQFPGGVKGWHSRAGGVEGGQFRKFPGSRYLAGGPGQGWLACEEDTEDGAILVGGTGEGVEEPELLLESQDQGPQEGGGGRI